ncbi:MAG: tyrosine--tRNA ligase [Bacteroidota bacterium]
MTSTFPSVEEQLATIRRGAEQILPEDALVEKLKKSVATGQPLTIKLGCDPSRPDLHIGHAVVLRKMRQFQDLGHKAILIIGDFTAMIGDPSGKSKTRPALTAEETRTNGQTYYDQAAKVLDTSPEKLEIRYNSEWLGAMSFADVIGLAGKYTVAQMLEREDFKNRYEGGQPISIHEFLYPLAQAQDSVFLDADVELGGTDQTFNLLVGRTLMERNDQEPQVCLTLPILEGTDGVQKMSKSLDNYIGVSEPPEETYGKTLSIPDALIYRYVELATDVPTDDLPEWKVFAEQNPRDAKHKLAWIITRIYHGEQAADAARAHFEKTVIQGGVPEDLDELTPEAENSTVSVVDLLRQAGFAESNGAARRLIKQGGIAIDGEKVTDPHAEVDLAATAPFVLKGGKRKYVRVVVG